MHTIFLPPFVVVMSIGIMVLLHVKIPVAELLTQPLNWLGLVLVAIGFAMASWHARLFRRIGTNINTFGKPGKLTREGLFRRTRNPMYLGMVIFLTGVACILGSVSPLIGPLVFFLLAQYWYIPLEEKAMYQKFGDEYLDYQRAVPRWL
ncbi:MAG: isoprenylcysteine carboxylmethyltransferase family protein [Cellvibrio sp.]